MLRHVGSVDIRNEFRRRRGVLRELLRVAVCEVLVEALRGETSSRNRATCTPYAPRRRPASAGTIRTTLRVRRSFKSDDDEPTAGARRRACCLKTKFSCQ